MYPAVGRRVLGLLAVITLAQGCAPVDSLSPSTQPDLEAIAKVVNDAYSTHGFGRPVLFLDTNEVCETVLPSCAAPDGGVLPDLKAQLEADLQVKVRPESDADRSGLSVPLLTPVLPETGEVGVSLSLGRFSVDEQGRLSVSVSIARSGLDGEIVLYALEPGSDGWIILESRITAVA